jgi:TrkA domain protein
MATPNLQETNLPGVGIQHDYSLENGQRIGVITHHSGRRDFLVFSDRDPDMCAMSLALTELEANTIGEMLGASQVTKSIAKMEEVVPGLSIDWLPISGEWACTDKTLATMNFSKTGALIVAVVRDGQTIPTPRGDFVVQAGDTLVVVGPAEGLSAAHDLLHGEVTA